MVGSLDTLSFYRRADSDETFVRHKGGPSEEKIMHSPRRSPEPLKRLAKMRDRHFWGKSEFKFESGEGLIVVSKESGV